MGNIIMSRKEIEQVSVFEKLKNDEISQKMAGKLLKLSPRWIREKLKRFRLDGAKGLVYRGRGMHSSRKWDEVCKQRALKLLEGEFQDFGPTFAAEKLELLHGIKVSRETLRKNMINAGLCRTFKFT